MRDRLTVPWTSTSAATPSSWARPCGPWPSPAARPGTRSGPRCSSNGRTARVRPCRSATAAIAGALSVLAPAAGGTGGAIAEAAASYNKFGRKPRGRRQRPPQRCPDVRRGHRPATSSARSPARPCGAGPRRAAPRRRWNRHRRRRGKAGQQRGGQDFPARHRRRRLRTNVWAGIVTGHRRAVPGRPAA